MKQISLGLACNRPIAVKTKEARKLANRSTCLRMFSLGCCRVSDGVDKYALRFGIIQGSRAQ